MNNLKLSDLFLGLLIIVLIIPKTRSFIQVNIHALLSKLSKVQLIDSEDQNAIEYEGVIKAINTPSNVDFSSLEGEVVFVNFWATWCPPCIAEMESIQSLYNNYGDKVRFLLITNDSAEVTNEFLTKHNYSLPCYNQSTPLSEALEHSSIPSTYIINRQGNVVVKKTGAIDWNGKQIHSIVNELLKE